MNLLPNIRLEIRHRRGRRCLRELLDVFSLFFLPSAKRLRTLSSHEGCFPPTGGGRGDSKEEDFFLDVMPSSHTPFGPWQKTSSKEKALEPANALQRKILNFLDGLLQYGGFFLFFFRESHNHGSRDAFGMW